jgi:putative FmdB family regulatory protein
MPLYEYACQACGRRLERIQKFSDPPLETCPHCGGRLDKLLSSPAIQFKGSGWYVTDYARKSDKPSSESDTAKTKDSAKGAASSSSETPAKSGSEISGSKETKPKPSSSTGGSSSE